MKTLKELQAERHAAFEASEQAYHQCRSSEAAWVDARYEMGKIDQEIETFLRETKP